MQGMNLLCRNHFPWGELWGRLVERLFSFSSMCSVCFSFPSKRICSGSNSHVNTPLMPVLLSMWQRVSCLLLVAGALLYVCVFGTWVFSLTLTWALLVQCLLATRGGTGSEGSDSYHWASAYCQDQAQYWGETPGSHPMGVCGGKKKLNIWSSWSTLHLAASQLPPL